jgi:hypothetical protein
LFGEAFGALLFELAIEYRNDFRAGHSNMSKEKAPAGEGQGLV